LGSWAARTRAAYRANRLADNQVTALDALGFAIDPVAANWEHAFSVAARFAAEHGHLRPASDFRSQDVTLADWLAKQRQHRRRGTLPADYEARLTALGIQWEIPQPTWEQRLDEL